MGKTRLYFLVMLIISGMLFVVNGFATDSPFPGLMAYLNGQYGSPYQVIGKVREVSKDKLLFQRNQAALHRGQELWIFDHKPGLSPQLQVHVANIQVEAIFPRSVLGRIIKTLERPPQQEDLVLSPPVPAIYLFTNIKAKHAFPPYQKLLKDLISAGYEVKETLARTLPTSPCPGDLVLRLEVEEGHLVCQLLNGIKGSLLYTESIPITQKIQTEFPAGQTLVVGSLAPPKIASAAQPAHTFAAPASTAPPATKNTGTEAQQPAFVSTTFQTAVPSTKSDFYRLSRECSHVVSCDLDGDGAPELALLSQDSLSVFHLSGGRLVEFATYPIPRDLIPIHLHAMDLNGDGGDELFITIVELVEVMDKHDNRLVSQILTYKGNHLIPLKTKMPYYLRVIRDRRGIKVALAQKQGEYKQFSGPVYQVLWSGQNNVPEIGQEYGPAKNVYSVYQFNLVPDDPKRIIILEPSNDLHGYFAPDERLEATGERNYGRFEEIGYPIKLEKDRYLGGFDKETSREVFGPRRFELHPEFDGQSFLICKERLGGWIRRTAKKIFSSKEGLDQVVGVKWSGNRIIETWKSKRLAKDILDFTFLNNPDRIMILYRDGDGYALEAFYQ